MKMLNLLLLCLAMALFTGACGDDSSDEADGGGDGDGDGDSGDGDGTADAGPMTFMCEDVTCSEPEINTEGLMVPPEFQALLTPEMISAFVSVQGCCIAGGDNVCGVMSDTGCVEQSQAGEADEACPGIEVDVMGFPLPLAGCCKPTGQCGFDFGVIGIGCFERSEAAAGTVMGMSLPGAADIESIACGDGGDDGGTDAGMDAGN